MSVFDAHPGPVLPGRPGDIVRRYHGAVLVRTGDVLPRRVGPHRAESLAGRCEPVDVAEAARIGLVDAALAGPPAVFDEAVLEYAARLATRSDYPSLLEHKRAARAADERRRPLEAYRAEELALMHRDIFDDRRGFAAARHAFVTKRARSSSGGARPAAA